MFTEFAPQLIWFIVGFLLMMGELIIPVFICIFFGAGAWLTALIVLLGWAPALNTQLLIFILSSVIAIILFRHSTRLLVKTHRSPGANQTASGSVVGSHGVVSTEIIPNLFSGRVELNGTLWQAIADESIAKGVEVVIVEQNNLTVKVKPIY